MLTAVRRTGLWNWGRDEHQFVVLPKGGIAEPTWPGSATIEGSPRL